MGSPQQSMDDRQKRAKSAGGIGIWTSAVALRARDRYRSGWSDWDEFCDGMGDPRALIRIRKDGAI